MRGLTPHFFASKVPWASSYGAAIKGCLLETCREARASPVKEGGVFTTPTPTLFTGQAPVASSNGRPGRGYMCLVLTSHGRGIRTRFQAAASSQWSGTGEKAWSLPLPTPPEECVELEPFLTGITLWHGFCWVRQGIRG